MEETSRFVAEDPAVAGEMQGWGCFDDFPILLLLTLFKLSFLLGRARGGWASGFANVFFLPRSDYSICLTLKPVTNRCKGTDYQHWRKIGGLNPECPHPLAPSPEAGPPFLWARVQWRPLLISSSCLPSSCPSQGSVLNLWTHWPVRPNSFTPIPIEQSLWGGGGGVEGGKIAFQAYK